VNSTAGISNFPAERGIAINSYVLVPVVLLVVVFTLSLTFGSKSSNPAGNSTFGVPISLIFPLPLTLTLTVTASFVLSLDLSRLASSLYVPTAPIKDSGASAGSSFMFMDTVCSAAVFCNSLLLQKIHQKLIVSVLIGLDTQQQVRTGNFEPILFLWEK
jgi:hypothetical protein